MFLEQNEETFSNKLTNIWQTVAKFGPRKYFSRSCVAGVADVFVITTLGVQSSIKFENVNPFEAMLPPYKEAGVQIEEQAE